MPSRSAARSQQQQQRPRGEQRREETAVVAANRSGGLWGSAVSVGTTALAVYGGYQLACLAYDAWNETYGTTTTTTTREEEEEATGRMVYIQEGHEEVRSEASTNTARSWATARSRVSSSATSQQGSLYFWSHLWDRMTATTPTTATLTASGLPLSFFGNGALHQASLSPASLARRRRQQLRQCRDQVRRVLQQLVPGVLKRLILHGTDFTPQRVELKALRSAEADGDKDDSQLEAKQVQLWNVILQQTLSRLVLTLYAPSLLFVVLTVQVSIMWGKQHKHKQQPPKHDEDDDDDDDELNNSPSDLEDNGRHAESDADCRWVLDQTYQYMFQHGLPSLVETVQRLVAQVLAEEEDDKEACWNVMDTTSVQFTPTLLQERLLQRVHQGLRHDATLDRKRSLLRFVQPPSVYLSENGDQTKDHARDARRTALVDETWDVLESPMVDDAIHDALHLLQKRMLQDVFAARSGGSDDSRSAASTTTAPLPLVQVLTRLKQVCKTFFATFAAAAQASDDDDDDRHDEPEEDDNVYLQSWEHLPSILEAMDVCFDQ